MTAVLSVGSSGSTSLLKAASTSETSSRPLSSCMYGRNCSNCAVCAMSQACCRCSPGCSKPARATSTAANAVPALSITAAGALLLSVIRGPSTQVSSRTASCAEVPAAVFRAASSIKRCAFDSTGTGHSTCLQSVSVVEIAAWSD
eukprot:16923-Heterococcus_DN1.PRE.2